MLERYALPVSVIVATFILSVMFRYETSQFNSAVLVYDRWSGSVAVCGAIKAEFSRGPCLNFPNAGDFRRLSLGVGAPEVN